MATKERQLIHNFIVKTCELEKVDFIKDEMRYFLNMSYIINTEHSISRMAFNLNLPITITGFDIPCIGENGKPLQINVGFGPLNVHDYTIEILEEKKVDMTLAEIEKRLGYKINLVSEESRE